MKTLTEMINEVDFDGGLVDGASRHKPLTNAKKRWAEVRAHYGLQGAPMILTEPRGNNKLSKAATPSYGLTLQHYVQKFKGLKITVNACPNAGDCTKVCVLDNGYGMMPGIQEARRARTEFLVMYPYEAGVLIGREIQRAVEMHGRILFRPNVNSDVEWERVAPSLTSGAIWSHDVESYGYTKLPHVLDTDGWLDDFYRVAYSWNEHSDYEAVSAFLDNGGSVAVVTERRKGEPCTTTDRWWPVIDADLTDEWIFENAVGDLSAKGRARKLIGNSGFVVTTSPITINA
jgi:hypothetical protein